MQLAAPIHVDENAFVHWLKAGQPGDRLVYHVGHLGFDRDIVSGLPRTRREALVRIANRAMALAESGCLLLAQQRLADGRMAYLAILSKEAA